MELLIDIEFEGRFLIVTASGNFTFDAASRLLKQALDEAQEEGTNKTLVNCLAMYGGLSTFETYDLGVEIAEYLRQRRTNPALALVGKPPIVDGFGVRVGQNRGLLAEVFSTQQEAIDWLEKWSNFDSAKQQPGSSGEIRD